MNGNSPNALINESSPYLLQHAHNPVNWLPWRDDVWEKAKKENKMVIISIGYSSCHWCHVMEHESFEDEQVAKVMNDHFISIKVDREERPDIDQVYMTAVQLMTGRGGWPLNCITLPDGRPVYGGTYFPKESWVNVLQALVHEQEQNPTKMEEYAAKLEEGIKQVELIDVNEAGMGIPKEEFHEMIRDVIGQFDEKRGGYNRAPKFPLPNNLEFFLHYHHLTGDAVFLAHVTNTLDQMANGGIYDQVGGGFARYSVDAQWKVPHFEKMLYDNAQLLGIYSNAFKCTGSTLYKHVVADTFSFLQREMKGDDGLYYSALDADSEGEEGKFYVWTQEELQQVLNEQELQQMKHYFLFGEETLWEHGNHNLVRNPDADLEDEAYDQLRKKLLKAREKRTRPGLDDKGLTSWNALLVAALADAYEAFGEEQYRSEAQMVLDKVLQFQLQEDDMLYHSFKEGKGSITGFLEDYALLIHACTRCYEISFDEQYLEEARRMVRYVLEHFTNEENGLFYFTANNVPELITRKTEVTDNVMPGSNSVMAINLFRLGHLLYNPKWVEMAQQMLHNMEPHFETYPMSYSNWLKLWGMCNYAFYETCVTGPDALKLKEKVAASYLPNNIFAGAINNSALEILQGRLNVDQSLIYVCVNKTCQLPVASPEEALKQLRH